MSYTQEEVNALREAIARGATEVQRGEERVKFASLDEMRKQLSIMEAQMAGESRRSRMKVVAPKMTRGL